MRPKDFMTDEELKKLEKIRQRMQSAKTPQELFDCEKDFRILLFNIAQRMKLVME